MLLTLYVVIDKIKIRDKFRKVHSKFSPEIMVISANFNDTSTMKTIARSIIAFIAILTCLFGPAAFGQGSPNVSTNGVVHVSQTYVQKGAEITYKIALRPAIQNDIDPEDLRSWGAGILDRLDQKLGERYLKSTNRPTPKVKDEFLKDASDIAAKYMKENGITGVKVTRLSFSVDGSSTGTTSQAPSKPTWGD